MCELLVMVKGKPRSGNVTVDCHREDRGDVIAVMPDGHDWTHEERRHPRWVIVSVPGMSLVEGQALASCEPLETHRRYFHKRLFHLSHALLPIGDRAAEIMTLDLAAIRAAKSRKLPVVDPQVIGEPTHPNVIG